jgi:hypothetical protein
MMYGVVSLTLGLLPTPKGITEFSKLLEKRLHPCREYDDVINVIVSTHICTIGSLIMAVS